MEGEAQVNQTSDTEGKTPETDNKGKQGDAPKMVPESDLLAVKRGSEKAVTDAKASSAAEIARLTARIDTEHQTVVERQADIVRLEGQLEESSANKTKAEELTTSIATLTKERDKANTALLEVTKAKLASQFNVPIDSIKDKTQAELNTLEDALKLVGAKGKVNSGYDTGPGGVGAGNAQATAHERCLAEVADARERAGQSRE